MPSSFFKTKTATAAVLAPIVFFSFVFLVAVLLGISYRVSCLKADGLSSCDHVRAGLSWLIIFIVITLIIILLVAVVVVDVALINRNLSAFMAGLGPCFFYRLTRMQMRFSVLPSLDASLCWFLPGFPGFRFVSCSRFRSCQMNPYANDELCKWATLLRLSSPSVSCSRVFPSLDGFSSKLGFTHRPVRLWWRMQIRKLTLAIGYMISSFTRIYAN